MKEKYYLTKTILKPFTYLYFSHLAVLTAVVVVIVDIIIITICSLLMY
jgi:hypothetical protein